MSPLMLMLYIFNLLPNTVQDPSDQNAIKEATDKINQRFISPRFVALLEFINEELSKKKYLAGEKLTAADIVSLYCIDALNRMKLYDSSKEYTNIGRYAEMLRARPAYQRAVAKEQENN